MHLRKWIGSGQPNEAPEYLALPLELEDGRPSHLYGRMMRYCILGAVAAGAWAWLTPVRELAIAPGQITPKGDVRSVQHLEGGVVSAVRATAGGKVRKGDPLVVLSDQQSANELRQYQVRGTALAMQKQQITALLQSTDLDLKGATAVFASLAHAQQGVFAARLQARLDETKTLQARVDQRRSEIAATSKEIESYKRVVEIRQEYLDTRTTLYQKGLATRKDFLSGQVAMEQAKTQQVTAEGRLSSLNEQLNEASGQLQAAETAARKLWSEELARVEADHGETLQSIAKLQDRVERLTVRSPVEGVVQFVLPRSSGEVVKPGDTIASIVPTEASLLAEVEVRADDVGHVKPGNKADVKVSTFDPSVYGKLRGEVVDVSASSFQRQNGEYYFKAKIALDDPRLSGHLPVSAGMVVSAEIVTGAKSFAQYLLKPVYKTFGPAFSEK